MGPWLDEFGDKITNETFLFAPPGMYISSLLYSLRLGWRGILSVFAGTQTKQRASYFECPSSPPLLHWLQHNRLHIQKHAFSKTNFSLPSEEDTVSLIFLLIPWWRISSTLLMMLPFLRSGYYGRIQDFSQKMYQFYQTDRRMAHSRSHPWFLCIHPSLVLQGQIFRFRSSCSGASLSSWCTDHTKRSIQHVVYSHRVVGHSRHRFHVASILEKERKSNGLVIVEEVKVYLGMECGVFEICSRLLFLRLDTRMQMRADALNYILSIADFLVPFMFTAMTVGLNVLTVYIALSIDPNLFIEVMGSYRRWISRSHDYTHLMRVLRGKAHCGDIDILITRSTEDGKTHRREFKLKDAGILINYFPGVMPRLLRELHAADILSLFLRIQMILKPLIVGYAISLISKDPDAGGSIS